MVKCSSFNQRIVYLACRSTLVIFSSRKSYITMRRQVACEVFIVWSVPKTLSKKWYLCLYLTQTIQMVKYSFPNERIVYQSFYGTLLTFSYFFLPGIVLCFIAMREVACKMFIVWSIPKTLTNNCLSKFHWRIAQLELFFLQVKVLCFGMHWQVAC